MRATCIYEMAFKLLVAGEFVNRKKAAQAIKIARKCRTKPPIEGRGER